MQVSPFSDPAVRTAAAAMIGSLLGTGKSFDQFSQAARVPQPGDGVDESALRRSVRSFVSVELLDSLVSTGHLTATRNLGITTYAPAA